MAVTKRVRYEVLRRDNHQCRYCGGGAPDVVLTVDHVVPVALGGSDDPSNLVAACRDCNAGKTSTSPDGPLVADVDAKAALWAQAMKVVATRRAAERDEHDELCNYLHEHWQGYRPNQWASSDLPDDWENSIRAFVAAGLEVGDLDELMIVALTTRTVTAKWKYFCGCCWTRIRKAQESAAQVVSIWEQAEEEGEDEDYEVSEAEMYWAGIALKWNKRTGTRLLTCLCSGEPCNRNECTRHVATLAHGALLGIDEVAAKFTKQESGPAPQVEEVPDGA